MRLFVSLRPPAVALDHLAAALAGRPTNRRDQWHVTLAFLGEVPDPASLFEPLRTAAAAHPPPQLRLSGGGSFSGARAVWAGLAGDVEGLRALAADVQRACRDAGVPLEERHYRPHLTVGRLGRLDRQALAAYDGPSWRAGRIDLVRSVLGRTVEHTVLRTFPLRPA
ncbi:MAG: 2-5 ligase [Frankiales bacterium]|nr:2-5 ligase [Frankiales bacterium]